MDAYKTKIGHGTGGSVLPRHHIKSNDLTLLIESIDRWDRFLSRVFIIPMAGHMTAEILEKISLEDTEHYLDVKIQISQCLKTIQSAELERKFDEMCGGIRKATYHHISTTLPNLTDNARSLIELAHRDDPLFGESVPSLEWADSPDLELSQEYKDCLVLERKQLKSEVMRQRSSVRSQIVSLKKEINDNLYPRPTQH